MGVSLNLEIGVGVPGWDIDGEHVRLSEAVERTGDIELIREHTNALMLVELSYRKLAVELHEALEDQVRNMEGGDDSGV